MRNLTGALVFSTSLLLAVGCHKNTGESPDAATETGSTRGELQAGRDAASPEAPRTGLDAGSASPDAGGDRQALEACVDRWLKARNLDRYGSPAGTVYAGGTPLFDERTGETRDRMEFVFAQQPEAKKACASPDAGK